MSLFQRGFRQCDACDVVLSRTAAVEPSGVLPPYSIIASTRREELLDIFWREYGRVGQEEGWTLTLKKQQPLLNDSEDHARPPSSFHHVQASITCKTRSGKFEKGVFRRFNMGADEHAVESEHVWRRRGYPEARACEG